MQVALDVKDIDHLGSLEKDYCFNCFCVTAKNDELRKHLSEMEGKTCKAVAFAGQPLADVSSLTEEQDAWWQVA